MARFPKSKRLGLEEQLPPLIELQGLQHWKAAEILGVSEDWVQRACKRLGLETQRTGPRSGELHPDWKGGRILVGQYWYIYQPEHPNATQAGYVAEHRLKMEQWLKRYLEPHEVVHHHDGNPQNNDLDNLVVFRTNAEHLRHELTGRVPNWTSDGLERMRKGIERSANLRRSKRDADPHNQ